MSTAEYLRRQAENCLRIARSCFDLTSAERMRLMAADLRAKAAEIDSEEDMPPSFIGRNGSYSDRSNRR